MHVLATLLPLLPLLALASARDPHAHARDHVRRTPSRSAQHLDERGLLDGLFGGGATTTTTTTAAQGLLGGLLGSQPTSSSSSSSSLASATASSAASPTSAQATTPPTTTTAAGLLDGLLSPSTTSSSSSSSQPTDVVTGLLTGVTDVLGTTVTTLGGVVEDVADVNLQVLANTCVRLGTAADLGALGGATAGVSGVGGAGAASATDVVIAAGACVCVDAAASAGLNSGVYAGVEVYASGGLYFNGSTAEAIASSTQPTALGLQAGVYNFDVVETCIAAQVSLGYSHHDFSVPGGSCCARACDAGYTLSSSGACTPIPQCTSSEILCNDACYPRSSYTCPSGLPVPLSKRGSLDICPLGMERCSIGGSGPAEGNWECVDTQRDLESCGGCTFPSLSNPQATPQGTDCTSLPHVDQVSCLFGACKVLSCSRGFAPSQNGTSCESLAGGGAPRRRNVRVGGSRTLMPLRMDSV